MAAEDIRTELLRRIDDYLSGAATGASTWRWAEGAIDAKDWDTLPFDIQDAIHCIWLLHDEKGTWVPSLEEIRELRKKIQA